MNKSLGERKEKVDCDEYRYRHRQHDQQSPLF